MTKTSLAKGGRPDKQATELLGQHVVDVADSLFIAKGYTATSMTTIAACARVGKQTLYRRYPDKAADSEMIRPPIPI
jgi:TetR/AcrR family transcriptional regulator, regulator of autoinduction and epiphytic fitness